MASSDRQSPQFMLSDSPYPSYILSHQNRREFTRASVLEGQGWFRLNIIAFVLSGILCARGCDPKLTQFARRICVFVLEKLFSLRFENMSRHRRALLLQCATFASGFSGPIGCFLYVSTSSTRPSSRYTCTSGFGYSAIASSAARIQSSSTVSNARYALIHAASQSVFSAFDFPSWTGPTLVFIMSYFVFTLAIYRFLGDAPFTCHFARQCSLTVLSPSGPDIHLNVHSYMNSRARLMTSGNTLSERSAQVTARMLTLLMLFSSWRLLFVPLLDFVVHSRA